VAKAQSEKQGSALERQAAAEEKMAAKGEINVFLQLS
jgi:hypothetical protein